jgi:cytochrome c oxidase subunit 2
VLPGQANTLVLQADRPGRYSGQCKEFCGLSHAYMKFAVVAHAPDDYEAWVRNEQADAVTPDRGSWRDRDDVFLNGQHACHAVQGSRTRTGTRWWRTAATI